MLKKIIALLIISGLIVLGSIWTFNKFKAPDKPDMGLGYQDEGSAKKKPRIVGGIEASSTDWPWVAGIVYSGVSSNYNAQFCGGTVIHPYWVATAAHCVSKKYGDRNLEPRDIKILVGAHDLGSGEGRRIEVKRIVIHPSYDSARYVNDIALIELQEPAGVETLPIYEGSDDLAGINAVAIGWGSMSSDRNRPSYPEKRQQVTLPIADQWQCGATYGNLVKNTMLCAGLPEGGKDACQGDSGGPLAFQNESAWKLAGITSWGVGCAQPGKYGVYTRVSSYRDFIREYVPNETGCNIFQRSFRAETVEIPKTGVPVRFTADAWSECGETLFFNYSYTPDYGTPQYDPVNGRINVFGGDGYSDSGTVQVSFPSKGFYSFLTIVSPTRGYSDKAIMTGSTVAVRDSSSVSGGQCMIMPVSMSLSSSGRPLAGESVTIKVDAVSECVSPMYYHFVYAKDDGSGNINAIQGWKRMLSSGDGFTSANTISFAFQQEGRYIVLALISHTRNRNDAITTSGITVSVAGQ